MLTQTEEDVVLEKTRDLCNAILAQPDTQKWLRDQGLEPTGMAPDRFAQFIRADLAKWRRMIADVGIKPE